MGVERGHLLPLWLRDNFVLFGAAGVALVVFVGTLAYIVWRPKEVRPEPPRQVLQAFAVALDDRGTVDLQAKTLAVTLKFSGLPEDAAQRMRVEVAIDGREAQVSVQSVGKEIQAQASALLEEKVENLIRSNGVGAVLLVKGVCEYGGVVEHFDVSATRLQVVSKTVKELGLAFANFPEQTPTPKGTPRAKPSPTPAESPTPIIIVQPTPSDRKPSSTPQPTPTSTPRPRQIFPTPTPRPAAANRPEGVNSSTKSFKDMVMKRQKLMDKRRRAEEENKMAANQNKPEQE